MKNGWRPFVGAAVVGLCAPVLAHHSFAVFDADKTIDIAGKVKAFRYTNPHIWIDVDVSGPNGGTTTWGIETGPPTQLRKQGWSATIVKPGDAVRASIHPRRDGTPAGSLVTLNFADGTPVGKPRPKPGGGPKAERAATIDPATVHPQLRGLLGDLKFGYYRQPGGAAEGKDSGPTTNPRDLAGRYYPNESTLLAPGDLDRMLPYNDDGARIFKQRASEMIAGKLRPDPLSLCKPGGAIRYMNQGFPVQVAQTPAVVTMVHMEDHATRRIRIGGSHPANLKPSFMGDSIGRWEGNTLVVDTTGFRAGWIDEYGSPSSTSLHLVERISKRPDGTLVIEAEFTDPTYYRGTTKYRRTWKWQPSVSWDEIICEENNRDAPTANGRVG